MFDVIVGSNLLDVREAAKAGDLPSIAKLANYLHIGLHTRKDENRAMEIYEYVLSQKDRIACTETIWRTLNAKTHIHVARGEVELAEQTYIDLVQEITRHPPELWDCERLRNAAEWLLERRAPRESTIDT